MSRLKKAWLLPSSGKGILNHSKSLL